MPTHGGAERESQLTRSPAPFLLCSTPESWGTGPTPTAAAGMLEPVPLALLIHFPTLVLHMLLLHLIELYFYYFKE